MSVADFNRAYSDLQQNNATAIAEQTMLLKSRMESFYAKVEVFLIEDVIEQIDRNIEGLLKGTHLQTFFITHIDTDKRFQSVMSLLSVGNMGSEPLHKISGTQRNVLYDVFIMKMQETLEKKILPLYWKGKWLTKFSYKLGEGDLTIENFTERYTFISVGFTTNEAELKYL